MFNWRFFVWVGLVLGWTVAYFTKAKDINNYLTGTILITAVYLTTVAVYIYTQRFATLKRVGRGLAILLASTTYYILFKLSKTYLKFYIFREQDILMGFEIGVAIGIVYLVVDSIRFRKGRTDFGR